MTTYTKNLTVMMGDASGGILRLEVGLHPHVDQPKFRVSRHQFGY